MTDTPSARVSPPTPRTNPERSLKQPRRDRDRREPRAAANARYVVVVGVVTIVACMMPRADAHPLGNFTVNLYSGIRLSTGHVEVDYVLEMAELSTQEQKPGMDLDADGAISPEEMQGWADRAAAQLLTNLHLVVNGLPVELSTVSDSLRFRVGQAGLDLIYMEATYEGELPASGAAGYRDDNWKGRPGWREVTVSADPSVRLLTSSVPEQSISEELKSYPAARINDPLAVKGATFSFQAADVPVEGSTPPPPGAGGGSDTPGGSSSPAGDTSGLTGLLASAADRALFPILGLAFGFGFVHALGPGHGKVVIAASGVSRSIRLRHTLSIGAAIAAMHCATSVGLGLVALSASHVFSSEDVYSSLRILSAIVVLVIGAILLVVRLRQRSEHRRPHTHVHEHDPEEEGALPTSTQGRASLGAIVASGGLVPSPSAVVVMLGAVAAGRIAIGIAIVVVFSIGLATALVSVGVLSVYAGGLTARFLHRTSDWLPIASAAAILIVGVVLTASAIAA